MWAGGEWVEEELLGRVWRVGRERAVVRCQGLWLGAVRVLERRTGASARQLERELEDLVSCDERMLAAARSLGVSVSRAA
jgi:hypothetical protein